jgi:methionyl aminopeptidase
MIKLYEADIDEASGIRLHGEEGFAGMRAAGHLAASCLDYLTPFVKEGITTDELDTLARDYILKNGAVPAPLYYRGFPKSICTSLNPWYPGPT